MKCLQLETIIFYIQKRHQPVNKLIPLPLIIHNYIFHHFRKHLPAFPQSNTPKFHSRNHFFFSFFRYYNQGFRDHFNLLLRRIFHINTRLFDTFFCFFTKQKDPAFFNARSHFLFLILFSK